MERRTRGLERRFSLRAPRRRDLVAVALSVSVLPALVGIAASQPVIVHRELVTQRDDAEIFVIFDTSQSMSAQPGLGSPTRLQRAKRDVEELLPELGDIPIGIGTMTDRVLPNLMPTTDDALIRRTIEQSVGINQPPPSQLYPSEATNLKALFPLPSYRLFSNGAARHSILVVLTDGESPPPEPRIGADLAKELTIPPLFVHIGNADERIYRNGQVVRRYVPDSQSGSVLEQFARDTDGRVFGEGDLAALVRTIRTEAGPTRRETRLLGYERVALGPWFLLGGVLPLGFLFWRRNL
jgi:hypothetical protein